MNLAGPRSRLIAGAAALLILAPALAVAQLATRLSVLQAEDRRAQTPQDLATIRAAARSGDGLTARIGLRALGRLERPTLIPDILPGLRHTLPEVRAEAANAVAQAAQGLKTGGGPTGAVASAQAALMARLEVEADATVRAALCESIARLPYTAASDVQRAESALLDFAARALSNTDRLGLAKGLEALTRLQRAVRAPDKAIVDALLVLAGNGTGRREQDLLRDARVRRLALDALITLGAADPDTLNAASDDPDPQVRRLAVKAATLGGLDGVIARGLRDESPMVRIEALRTAHTRNAKEACSVGLAAASDPDMNVAVVAIDLLGACGQAEDAVAYLERLLADPADAEAPRNWHRAAHALVALAAAAPERAAPALERYVGAGAWQLRVFAAGAAALLKQRGPLALLIRDPDDNVVEAAIAGLANSAGHDADDLYVAALARAGFQVVRAAAIALEHSPKPDTALPALTLALHRAEDDGRPGAADARGALRAALASLGAPARVAKPGTEAAAPLNVVDLKRLAAPRARFTIRDVGRFDVALFTTEAPATVLRFAQLASSGYYNGLTFHRVVPNGVIQGGSPGANEYSSDVPFMRDEVGLWPHVRGALGISTRGRDTGDGQIFIDLVDNPRYDHTYTVFAQVLNGLDIVDRILEGDVIERVEVLP